MLLEVQCEDSTVSDDLGSHVICWCWSTVFSEVHSQRSHLPGNFRALHASFCWQTLWRSDFISSRTWHLPTLPNTQSLHVCKPWCKRVLVWYPLARLHGLKLKYFQHWDVTNCPAPHIENIPNRDTTVSYRTVNFVNRYTPYIYIYTHTHTQVHLNKLECRGKVHLFQ